MLGGPLLLPTLAGIPLSTLLSHLTVALLQTDQRIPRAGLVAALAVAAHTSGRLPTDLG